MTRMHALVVDDERRIRDVVAAALALDGWSVDVAKDGEDALAQLESRRPDVMLLDLRMPRLDGSGLLRRLAAMTEPPIVVVMSAYAEPRDIVEVMQLGAVDFLQKPFDPATLRRVMRAALETEPAHPPATRDEHLAAMKRHARRRLFDAAEADVRAALSTDSACADAHYFLGVLLEMKHESALAHAEYARALAAEPRMVAARKRMQKLDAVADMKAALASR